MHFFGPEIPYSYSLNDLVDAYMCYHRLMQHWAEVLPAGSMLTIRYEDLVGSFEATARRIISFAELPWEQSVLTPQSSGRRVKTASAVQVRQPIHQGSVGVWRKYEQHLQPLLRSLEEPIAQYEARDKFTMH